MADDKFYEPTQAALGLLIKKPALTEKLLSKPPFRFLFDIVTEVMSVSGFATGLFTADELNPTKAAETKESKIAYLQKIIDCTALALRLELKAKPAKIVAGIEPQYTNEWLVALSQAARLPEADQRRAVDLCLQGVKPPGPAKKEAEPQPQPQPQPQVQSQPAPRKETERSIEPRAEQPPPAPAPAPSSRRSESNSQSQSQSQSLPPQPQPQPQAQPQPQPQPQPQQQYYQQQPQAQQDHQQQDQEDDMFPPAPVNRAPQRPQSARRPPPKVKSNVRQIEEPERPVPGVNAHGGSMGPTPVSAAPNPNLFDDDDEIEEAPALPTTVVFDQPSSDSQEHSKLVREILSEQNPKNSSTGVSGTSTSSTGVAGKENVDMGVINSGELEQDRAAIQRLCGLASALSKGLDGVQEDVDSMTKERETWVRMHARYVAQYEEAMRETEGALAPYRAQLEEVEDKIRAQEQVCAALRGRIAANDARIEAMLRMVVGQSPM